MNTRALATAVVTAGITLACGEAEVLTDPAAKETLALAAVRVHGANAASHVEMAFAICPGEGSTDEVRTTGKVTHIRGSEVAVALRGDLEGQGFGRFDIDLVARRGGPARGNVRFTVTRLLGEAVEAGGFAGRHHGRFDGPDFSGRATGHGFGDLEGLKIRYDFMGRGEGNGFAVHGVITDPTGSLAAPDGSRVPPRCLRTR